MQDAKGQTPGLPKESQTGFIYPTGEDPQYRATQYVHVMREECDLSVELTEVVTFLRELISFH